MHTIIVGLQAMIPTRIYRFILITCCTLFVFGNKALAQKTYFVYLQSENQQPFYVNINGQNVSSSSIGYVILSKLTDSTYPVRIGFPGSDNVQDFYLTVNGDDKGFLIKNFGDKGWGLFNLQTMEVVMNSSEARQQREMLAAAAKQAAEEKRVADSLSEVYARRAEIKRQQDSISLAMASQEAVKTDTPSVSAAVTAADNQAATETTASLSSKPAEKINKPQEPVSKPVAAANEAVIPVTDTITATATGGQKTVSAARNPSGVKDSVVSTKQLISLDTSIAEQEPAAEKPQPSPQAATAENEASGLKPTEKPDTAVVEPVMATAQNSAVEKAQPVVENSGNAAPAAGSPKFLDMEMTADNPGYITMNKPAEKNDQKTRDSAGPVKSSKDEAANKKKPGFNGMVSNNENTTIVSEPAKRETVTTTAIPVSNNCKDEASDKDFFNLRKKMASTEDKEEMINIAKKIFRDKCFSTEQVRNLCVLFLDDEGRYSFLDEAYSHTSDPGKFRQLADLIKDDYYLKRFNAMLRF